MSGVGTPDQIFSNVGMMVDEVAKNLEGTEVPVTLIVSIEVKEDRLDEFIKVITKDAEGSRLEEGCYRFDVNRDPENPCKFTLYEAYKNAVAVEFHKETPHFKAFIDFEQSGGTKVFEI